MLIIPYIFLCIYLLFFRKKDKLAWLLVALIICFLSVTSTSYADIINYEPLFNYYNLANISSNPSITNITWFILCKLFYTIGFNYRGMILCLILIDYFFLHLGLKNLKVNENVFFGLFMIFPAIIQLVQIKFFTAFSIVFFAYTILIKNKKYSTIIFILLVLLATTIHSSVLIFLILIFSKNEKVNNKVLLIVTIAMSIFISLNLGFVTNISKYFISERQYNRYILNTSSPSTPKWIFTILLVWVACLILSKLIVKKGDIKDEKLSLLMKNESAITIFLLTIPLLFIDSNMHRFIEMAYCILMTSISTIFYNKKYTKNKLMYIFICICVFAIATLIYTPYATALHPIFSYNGFTNIFR